MAYNDTPLANEQLKNSQPLIRQNFISIQSAFSVDHAAIQSADQGKHNKLTMPVQVAAPVFAAGENGVYNLNNVATTKNELYVHKQSGAGTADIPFTASILSLNASPGFNSDGWSYLPSGILIKWGRVVLTPPFGVAKTITFPVSANIPVFQANSPFNVSVTPCFAVSDPGIRVYFGSATTVDFTVFVTAKTGDGANAIVEYIAIGR